MKGGYQHFYQLGCNCADVLKSFLCFLLWFKDKDKDKPPERRPFDRDKDLNLPRMSDDQKKSVIKKSKELGSRFQHPKSGSSYL